MSQLFHLCRIIHQPYFVFASIAYVVAIGADFAFTLDVNPPQPITLRVTVQPTILSNDDSSNTAEMFGTPEQSEDIEDLIDQIWAQAGIDIEFLEPQHWNNTTANLGDHSLGALGGQADNAGLEHPDRNVINAYFAEVVANLFGDGVDRGENFIDGYAWIGGNGISMAVGDNMVTTPIGRERVAKVMAHEIGHNLGLPHIVESLNLMQSFGSGERLNSSQIDTARSSRFAQEIPLADPGDFDNDGDFDGTDFLEWQKGNSPTPGSSSDLADWQTNHGLSALEAASVPEPATCTQMLSFLLCSTISRRLNRR